LYRWSETGPLYESINNRLPSTLELEDSILETTQLYAVSRESLLSHRKRVCGKFLMIEVDRYQSIDIDYPEDLIFANTVFKGLENGKG
jgi:CMP-N-acetylneuraminic acid synthetase